MKFQVGTLAAVLALGCSLSATSAFSLQAPSQHLALRNAGSVAAARSCINPVARRVGTQRKLAESDDDDDDEVDEPLADGVNSVSWLPSVVGAKKVEASTKGGEVSEDFVCPQKHGHGAQNICLVFSARMLSYCHCFHLAALCTPLILNTF